MQKGYTQIYTGFGKGKSTAAVGLAFRAAGRGLKVLVLQFMKGQDSGEHFSATLNDNLTFETLGPDYFYIPSEPSTEKGHQEHLAKGLARYDEAAASAQWDMIICDELIVAFSMGLVEEERILDIINTKPEKMELVLTGRGASDAMIEAADLVTEMREIKHYYRQNVPARPGIES